MPTLASIDRQLTRAARLLDRTATEIRDVKLNSARNIRRIGEALVSIFEVQHDIYRSRRDLLPKLLYETKLGREVLSNSALEPPGESQKAGRGVSSRRRKKGAGGSTRRR